MWALFLAGRLEVRDAPEPALAGPTDVSLRVLEVR
jgi:hypothetical protein